MKLIDIKMSELLLLAEEKTLICFGAGQQLHDACEGFAEEFFISKIDLIADNNTDNRVFSYGNRKIFINSISKCLELADKEPIILVTVSDCVEIIEQLNQIDKLKDCYCCIFSLMRDSIEPYKLPKNRNKDEKIKIPKILHYCWFGSKHIPEEFLKYIDTWKAYCPDYEIIRWDESNYNYKKNNYMYEAYENKMWGFVPDYARLDIIYQYGGIYLDTDVEIIRNIDDLLCDEAFSAFSSRTIVNNCFFGAIPNFAFIKEQLDIYKNLSFINDDGSLNLTTGPMHSTRFLSNEGLKLNNSLQTIKGMKLYPTDVISYIDFWTGNLVITDNTYAIHHGAGTWLDTNLQLKRRNSSTLFNQLLEDISKGVPSDIL